MGPAAFRRSCSVLSPRRKRESSESQASRRRGLVPLRYAPSSAVAPWRSPSLDRALEVVARDLDGGAAGMSLGVRGVQSDRLIVVGDRSLAVPHPVPGEAARDIGTGN